MAILFVVMGAEKFYKLIMRVAFYPVFLFKDSRKQNFLPRLICILLVIPITIGWLIGYAVLVSTILGVSLFG